MCRGWTFTQLRLQPIECPRRAAGERFHAVGAVPDPPFEAQGTRGTADEVPEPHALHPAMHDEPNGRHVGILSPTAQL